VDVAARKDLSCDTPAMVGEDFSGEACTQIAPSIITEDQAQALSASTTTPERGSKPPRRERSADPPRFVHHQFKLHGFVKFRQVSTRIPGDSRA